jgi:membrane protease subunit HflK
VRQGREPSEIAQLAAPLARALDAAWRRMDWWIAGMLVLYAVSGITVVKADEVAVILRWGRLVGNTPALQLHGPGLLFSLPRPIDRVVRVPVKRVSEVRIDTLSAANGQFADRYARTLDPITQGYALTGDQNIVHADAVARYRVRDAAEWAFYGPPPDHVLRVEVTAALVRSLGEMGVDRILADGRKALVAVAMRRAQHGLDACHSGLELTSLELTRLAPPAALAADFEAVQSAFINAETRRKEAQAYKETIIPRTQAEIQTATQTARGEAEREVAVARGHAAALLAMDREYRMNPSVVRERLYRDSVESAFAAAGATQWVPPPSGSKYHGLRITLPSGGGPTTPAKAENDRGDDDEKPQ